MLKENKATELTVQRENILELCDRMLEETSSSEPKLLYKQGVWYLCGEIEGVHCIPDGGNARCG
jgi:hypothetical protein